MQVLISLTRSRYLQPEWIQNCSKKKYGDRIVFWGGGIDTQETLPSGNLEEIRAEVLNQCEILSKQGGFIFNSVHNIQANVPVDNIIAMIDAVKEFNGDR